VLDWPCDLVFLGWFRWRSVDVRCEVAVAAALCP
jgi:hypothetical protein